MLQVHIYVRYLGLCHYLWCVIVHQFYSKQENKEQTATHVAAECKMNKKMPGLSTSCKTIIIWVYYPHRIRTCVKVPYNLAKFHTVKFLKNFNAKISMKFSHQENFMKFSITTCGCQLNVAVASSKSKTLRGLWLWIYANKLHGYCSLLITEMGLEKPHHCSVLNFILSTLFQQYFYTLFHFKKSLW